MSPKIRLGITLGCPAGVGPEIITKALQRRFPSDLSLLVLGDKTALEKAARITRGFLPPFISLKELEHPPDKALLPVSNLQEIEFGRPSKATAEAMVHYIKEGVRLCLEGKLHGLVTAPISKAALRLAGETFPGHTEMLAALTRAKEIAMAFYGKKLKIVLVTIHVPLEAVPKLLNVQKILTVTRLAYQFLKQDLGLASPRLALAALNPHAGEGGLFGNQEIRVLTPAVKEAQRQGLPLEGPFPADSLFFRAVAGEFDLVVSLYHDQGLIPFKLLHFRDGVNLTLGLPIIRTSVDHGTAYDLAGQGRASEESLLAAINLAYKMAKNRFF